MNVPGRGCVLLVEAEEPIHGIVADELMLRGFGVCAAETGDYATSLIENPPWEFDLLITGVEPARQTRAVPFPAPAAARAALDKQRRVKEHKGDA